MKINKKRIIYASVVVFLLAVTTSIAILMYIERNDYRNYLQGESDKNVYDLITEVDNVRTNLTKAAIVGSREQSIVVFEQIFMHASRASDKLNSLPIGLQRSNDITKFLSQIGDISATFARYISSGKELTDEDFKSIENLKKQSLQLESELNNLANDINRGKAAWGELRKNVGKVSANDQPGLISEKFRNIQTQIVQYPVLIYDGPFSDNVQEIKPKIESEQAVSKEEAVKAVYNAISKDRIEKIDLNSDQGKTKIDTYKFTITLKDSKSKAGCDISKHGGKLVYFINDREIKNASMDTKKASDLGSKYLESLGYTNMLPTYAMKYDNTITVNYVFQQQNIIIYPDQIKLKIALDNGEILGMEAEKYLVSHENARNLKAPAVNMETARKRVGKRLSISSIRLTIIPTITNTEAMCYEFTGSCSGDTFKVYINSETGFEERILQIINTPNGQLTI